MIGRRTLIGAILLLVLTQALPLWASPVITVSVLARKDGTSDTFTNNLAVQAGETIDLEFVARLAPVGTTNSTIGNVTSYDSTKDGINALKFNAYQDTGNQIQLNLAPVTLTNGFSNGSGASGGTQQIRSGSNNDLLNIRPIQNPGVLVGVSGVNTTIDVIVATGAATVSSVGTGSASSLNLSYLLPTQISSSFTASGKYNGGTAFTGTVTDADAVLGFSALNLTAVPEPIALSVIGLPLLLALRRPRRTV